MDTRLLLVGFFSVALSACGGGGSSSPPPQNQNRTPTATAQSVLTAPDTSVTGTLTGTDADGDVLSFSVSQAPTNGAVTLTGTQFEYVPNVGFAGTDSFSFTANDGAATSGAATVTINVNSAPVIAPQTFQTRDLATLQAQIVATDNDNDALTFAIDRAPTRGTLTIVDASTGTFEYIPDPQNAGDDSFELIVSDPFQTSAATEMNVNVALWQGIQQFGTGGEDLVSSGGLYVDEDDNLILAGRTGGVLGTGPLQGALDTWLAKYDQLGNRIWLRQVGTPGDDGGRVIVSDPISGGTTLISTGGSTGEIVYRFDKDGNQLSAQTIDYQGKNMLLGTYWADVGVGGDVYALSWESAVASTVTKVIAATGLTDWQLDLAGTLEIGATPIDPTWEAIQSRSIDFDASGNAVVVGRVDGAADSFIANVSPNGDLLTISALPSWGNACAPGDSPTLNRMSIADDGTIWVSGFRSSSAERYVQIARYSADATTQLWAYCYDGGPNDVLSFNRPAFTENGDGLFVITESFLNPTTNETRNESLVVRLAPDGSEIFARRITGTLPNGDPADVTASTVTEGRDGAIFVVGSTTGELSVGASMGDRDAFLLRLDKDGNPRN